MNTLSKEAEDKILDAIQDVCQYVNDGVAPTEAVIKVAEEQNLSPNFIRLVCSGYNTGATTHQREKCSNILDKLAAFPIADTEKVINKIYPVGDAAKSAVLKTASISGDYSVAPKPVKRVTQTSVKTASTATKAHSGPKQDLAKHAHNSVIALRKTLNTKRAEYADAQEQLLGTISKLADFFSYQKNIYSFAKAAELRYGNTGKCLINCIMARGRNIKSAATNELITADWSSGPGLLFDNAIKLSHDVLRLSSEYTALVQNTEVKIAETYAPFLDTQSQISTQPKTILIRDSANTLNKQADGFLGGLLGGALMRSMGVVGSAGLGSTSLAKTPSELSTSMADDLDDPVHDDELRKIQARAMMQDLMMNDEVIAGYDPAEVMDAYNEITKVTPRSAAQKAIIRPLLRKRLTQGSIEPFEAAEMVNIEKNLGPQQSFGGGQHMGKLSEEKPNVLRTNILG
jgi:hypothetical protein